MTKKISRRHFIQLAGAVTLGALAPWRLDSAEAAENWQDLLDYYAASTRGNIVEVNGRRALLSSRLYPGTYIRDAVFWGPLALGDSDLGFECYQWFAETQMENGQIRSAVPLRPEEAKLLEPKDDEGGLLFVLASDWLRRQGYPVDRGCIERAYAWVQTHVRNHTYISSRGPFRYWADTVSPNVSEAISHNQGLLCLARRAMRRMILGGVTDQDVAAAQARYRSFYNVTRGYLTLGWYSNFAWAQDISAVFPEFLSRYLYNEPILTDQMVVNHVERILKNAAVYFTDGRLAGVKVISSSMGGFLPQSWFFAAGLNPPGDYQNGGYWPMYTIIALALAYTLTHNAKYAQMIGQLVVNELGPDHQSKEIIRLTPGAVGTFDPSRSDYTWNALVQTACRWCGVGYSYLLQPTP
jgi:hypothetical protein